jgi:hypothetical protein
MESMLTQLQDNELILLMYVAGELPAQDMAEIQHMLDTDAALRAQLERLRQDLATLDQHFAADASSNPARRSAAPSDAACSNAADWPFRSEAVARQTIRAMQQWRVQAARRPAAEPSRRRRVSLPWWGYTAAAAAVLLLAFSIFLAYSSPGVLPAVPTLTQAPDWTDSNLAELPAQEEVAAYLSAADLDRNTFDDADQMMAEASNNAGITEAEAKLDTLQRATNDMDFNTLW